MAAADFVCISKDRNIARVGIEVDAVSASGARLLLLPNARLTARELVARLLLHERAILRLVHLEDRPWIAVLQATKVERLTLEN